MDRPTGSTTSPKGPTSARVIEPHFSPGPAPIQKEDYGNRTGTSESWEGGDGRAGDGPARQKIAFQ